jgi:hypothetical protein
MRQVTRSVRKTSDARQDSLLAHCIARAVIADEGGVDAATAKFGQGAQRLSKWSALRAGARATPKASRVASFIVQWAIAMREDGEETYSITAYQRHWAENERRAYRLQKEFRELWPEYETPNELATQIVKHLDPKTNARDAMSLPARLMVTA